MVFLFIDLDLNFPQISKQTVISKFKKLIEMYEKIERGRQVNSLENVFDITKFGGFWMSSEDKNLYKIQIESNGKEGYSTKFPASISSVHPSKRTKLNKIESASNECITTPCLSDTSSTDESSNESHMYLEQKKKYRKASNCTKRIVQPLF